MKKLLLSLLIPALSMSAFSQDAFQVEALFSKENGEKFVGWILVATETQVRYKTTAVSTDSTDGKISDFAAIFVVEPAAYTAAMDLFEARKYKEAKEAFAAFKEYSKPIAKMKNNHHTLAAFYEMESMRKLGDLEGLATALQSFIKEPLTRDHQLRQLDLYVIWDAVRTKSWDRVLLITTERDDEALPGYQRAQVAYSKGLALQNLDRGSEALIAYGIAMTADSGASEELTQDAALNALSIYFKDEEIQTAISVWGTDDENKNSGGYTRLKDAAALAKLYDSLIKTSKPLPTDLKNFLKYGG